MMMSSLYIDRVVFPTHMYCATANNFADMQLFEEAMVWGAVAFDKYVDKKSIISINTTQRVF